MTHSSLLVLTASVTLTAALAAAAQSPLATAGQHALDRQSLRVLASEPVKTETALVAQRVRSVRLVKVAALESTLPRVSPAERQLRLNKRAAAYARRYAG
jgi:hypothetical protein